MVTKTTDAGRAYEIDGKRFTWHPLDDDDEAGNLADVVIPLRIKLGAIRKLAGQDLDNVATMFEMLERLIPGQAEQLDEMDTNDFIAMFSTWNDAYQQLSGATLGE